MTSSLETLVRERIKEFEIRDLIASCCTCPEERTFVEMREAGYRLKEIAEAVKMPLASLNVLVADLYDRVLAKSGLRDIREEPE